MSGLLSTLQWRLERLGLVAWRRRLVFYCLQPLAARGAPALPEGFEFRLIQAAELEPLGYPGGWLTLGEARQWMERGDSDLLAMVRNNRICSYLWVERRIARIDYLDLHVPLQEGHAYISKVLVAKEWRRHGLARAMYEAVAARESGRVVHSACVVRNKPMHRLFAQLGWQRRLVITSWRLPGLRWFDIRPVHRADTARFLSPEQAAEALFAVQEDGS